MKTVSKKLLSLLLVAILLVSAIPFQAFATNPHDALLHTVRYEKVDALTHNVICNTDGCEKKDAVVDTVSHNWGTGANGNVCQDCGFTHQCANKGKLDAYGKCSICAYQCPTHEMVANPAGTAASSATCFAPGYTGDKKCMTCGLIENGAVIPQLDHEYEGNTCKYCKATKPTDPTDPESYHTVVFDANPGKIVGGSEVFTVSAKNGDIISGIPQGTRTGYTFDYWYSETDPSIRVYANPTGSVTYNPSMGDRFIAQYTLITKQVDVYAVLNGDYSKPMSGYVWRGNVPDNVNLLDYMKTDAVKTAVNNAVAAIPGYAWDNIYRDRSGNPLADGTANQAQNVYVNFTSVKYTITLDPNGGAVAPSTIDAYVGRKIGTLPTPYLEGQVFIGWVDKTDNDKVYTEETVYNYAGNKLLTAQWKSEAKVWLNVYVNDNFGKADRYIPIDSYVVGDHIYYTKIEELLRQYYTPAAGSTMVVNGLFDKGTWNSYRSNPSQERKNDILISSNTDTEIFVMVKGVTTGSTVIPTTPTTPTNPTVPANGFWVRDLNGNLIWYPAGSSLPAGSGYWILDANGNPNIWVITSGSIIPTYIYVGSNPKTGDTAQIEIAAAVMVLAAAALITIMALRKKKSV